MDVSSYTLPKLARSCRRRLTQLSLDLEPLNPYKSRVERQQVYFDEWVEATGVLARGHRSLTYRLRYDVDAHNAFLRLLEAIEDVVAQYDSSSPFNSNYVSRNRDLESKARVPREEALHGSSKWPGKLRSSIRNLYQELQTDIDRLRRFTKLVLDRAVEETNTIATAYDPPDKYGLSMTNDFENYVKRVYYRELEFREGNSKYTVKEYLKARLLRVVTLRWKRISYQRNRPSHASLSRPVSPELLLNTSFDSAADPIQSAQTSPDLAKLQTWSDHDAFPLHEAPSVQRNEEPGTLPDRDSEKSSWSSSISGSEEGSSASLRTQTTRLGPMGEGPHEQDYPLPPFMEASDRTFDCPTCKFPQPIDNASSPAWESHVMHDLQPYFCIIEECTSPDATFRTVEDWHRHIGSQHTEHIWICQLCRDDESGCEFANEVEFKRHLKQNHLSGVPDKQIDMVAKVSSIGRPKQISECPFCGYAEPIKRLEQRDYLLHIGTQHLQFFALLSLPWDIEDDDARSNQETHGAHASSKHELSDGYDKLSDWSNGSACDEDYHADDSEVFMSSSTLTAQALQKLGDLSREDPGDWMNKLDVYQEAPLELEQNSNEALLESASRGHPEIVKELLHRPIDLTFRDQNGLTAVHCAVLGKGRQHVECLRLLIKAGADIEAGNKVFGTPSILAAASGQLDCLRELSISGANLDSGMGDFGSALHAASSTGQAALITYLLDKGVEANTERKYDHSSLEKFHSLVSHAPQGRISNGADQELQRSERSLKLFSAICQPLFVAAYCGNFDAAVALVFNSNVDAPADWELVHKVPDRKSLATTVPPEDKYLKGSRTTALIMAAWLGHVDIVDLLIKHRADVNYCDDELHVALRSAVSKDFVAVVKALIRAHADLNHRSAKGVNSVMIAAAKGYRESLQLLCHNKANLDLRDALGETATMKAARNGHPDCVFVLAHYGALVNTPSTSGATALGVALEAGHLGCVRELVLGGASLSAPARTGEPCIVFAARSVNVGGLKTMLAPTQFTVPVEDLVWRYTSVTASRPLPTSSSLAERIRGHDWHQEVRKAVACCNERGETALLAAAVSGRAENIATILEYGEGLSIDKQDEFGRSALMVASLTGNPASLGHLLRYKANVNLRDKLQRTSLMYLAIRNDYACAKLLLDHNAEIDASDKRQKTALMLAAESGAEGFTRFLINHKADPNLQDLAGNTALTFAALNGYDKCVLALASSGASVDLRNRSGKTALGIAVANTDYESVCALLAHDASIDSLKSEFDKLTLYENLRSLSTDATTTIGPSRDSAMGAEEKIKACLEKLERSQSDLETSLNVILFGKWWKRRASGKQVIR